MSQRRHDCLCLSRRLRRREWPHSGGGSGDLISLIRQIRQIRQISGRIRRIGLIRLIRPREKTSRAICGQEGQTHKRSLRQTAHPENNLRQSAQSADKNLPRNPRTGRANTQALPAPAVHPENNLRKSAKSADKNRTDAWGRSYGSILKLSPVTIRYEAVTHLLCKGCNSTRLIFSMEHDLSYFTTSDCAA